MSNVIVGSTLLSNLHQRLGEQIAEHKGWYFLQSLACAVVGILAIVLPTFTSWSFGVVAGALLVASGLIKAITGIKSQIHWWSLLSAGLSMFIGGLMLWQPTSGIITLATLVAVFLLVEGITEISLGLEFESTRNWGWMALSGIISIVLSVVLFFGWPGMTVTFLGIMIGINLFLYGASLLAVSAGAPRYEIL